MLTSSPRRLWRRAALAAAVLTVAGALSACGSAIAGPSYGDGYGAATGNSAGLVGGASGTDPRFVDPNRQIADGANVVFPVKPGSNPYPVHPANATLSYGGDGRGTSQPGWSTFTSTPWCSAFVSCFGGVDDPASRNGDNPAGFTPKTSAFYVGLPCIDAVTRNGHPALDPEFKTAVLGTATNYTGLAPLGFTAGVSEDWPYLKPTPAHSQLKAQWVAIANSRGQAVEAQFMFVNGTVNDCAYVLGLSTTPPKDWNASLAVSPAVQNRLGLQPGEFVSWQIVLPPYHTSGPWDIRAAFPNN